MEEVAQPLTHGRIEAPREDVTAETVADGGVAQPELGDELADAHGVRLEEALDADAAAAVDADSGLREKQHGARAVRA